MDCFPSLPLKFRYTSGEHDPLHDFYIPVLRLARRYDRAAGYFSSNAFVVAAQGVAHLIAHEGTMRLLVGAQLSPEDAEAIRRGEEERERVLAAALARWLPDPQALADRIARQRLEALAWLVAEGRLQIRVVLPEQPTPDRPYFHVKYGVLTDACGHRVAFHGSVNETASGWRTNYEDFSVFRSWMPGEDERVEDFAREFERIWRNEHPGWRAYPIPEAARRRLLHFRPSEPPVQDPLEQIAQQRATREPESAYQVRSVAPWVARFLRDAPFFPNAQGLGQATAAVEPWPHQTFVLRHILEHYPQRFLIADEVGLGKTIEAGLLLRQLKLMGLAQRVLILAPKSVLRQWQEELYEKFNLLVPIYDGHDYQAWNGQRTTAPPGPAAWNAEPWLLASAQLARRKERREDLLTAQRWDVIIVDEAHHARRRDFLDLNRYRPNQLLQLLQALSRRTEFLLLLTATPMQVHPVEVWDLLSLLGLSGRWAVGEGRTFLAFFEALEKRPPRWEQVLPLVYDELQVRGKEGVIVDVPNLTSPQRQRLQRMLASANPSGVWKHYSPEQQEALQGPLLRLARQHTPLRRLVLRHTRALLRQYQEQGLLHASIPRRRPQPRWILMSTEEVALYREVSRYISTFYRRYEETRRGLGFVLTVYRRRLTSSLYALRSSLERRLEALRQHQRLLEGEDEESAERLFLEEDAPEDAFVDALPSVLRDEEIRTLEALVERMHSSGDHDTKSAQLLQDLQNILQLREKVLIFTQYTDTLDYLRDRLKVVYGTALACYSGRGGERWDGTHWKMVSKEEVKNAFAQGEVRILLATDAASEGLNLQTCGVLINYDMPWNPMRVEQRIGRIDRIGQIHDEVWIYHYFYEGTIEEKVYRRLGERIGYFQQVVGPLQPILARVEDLLEQLAVLPPEEQEVRLEQLLATWDREATTTAFDLDAWSAQVEPEATIVEPVPWSPSELEAWVAEAPSLRRGLYSLGEGRYEFRPEHGNSILVTFRPEVFEAYPNTVSLLTYGSPVWDAWLKYLAEILMEQGEVNKRILILRDEGPPLTVAWYVRDFHSGVRRILTLSQLRDVLAHWEELPLWDESTLHQARTEFSRIVRARMQWLDDNVKINRYLQHSALLAQGEMLLGQAAALAKALMDREPLFAKHRSSSQEVTRILQSWGEPFGEGIQVFLQYGGRITMDKDAYRRFAHVERREDLTRAQRRLAKRLSSWLEEWYFLESGLRNG